MAEGIAVALVLDAVKALVSNLWDVRASVKHNEAALRDIDELVNDLNKNFTRMKSLVPVTINGDALESLRAKLKQASEFVQSRHRDGYFKSVWSAKDTRDQLGVMRRDIESAFQMTLLVTNLEVALHSDKKTSNFQQEMLRIYEIHASDTAQAKEDLKKVLGHLMQEVTPTIQELKAVVNLVNNLDQTSQTEKFFADVLANITSVSSSSEAQSSRTEDTARENLCDPITCEIMCDPVKASDGYTYDRWTIINHGLIKSPFMPNKTGPFRIVCDDINIRRSLFEQIPSTELRFHQQRKNYKEKALKLFSNGHDAESLRMLEYVLQWDEDDKECERVHGMLLNKRLQQQSASSFGVKQESEPVALLRAVEYIEEIVEGTTQESLLRTTGAFSTLLTDFKDVEAIGTEPGVLERLVFPFNSRNISIVIQEGLIFALKKLLTSEKNLVKFSESPECTNTLIDLLANRESPRLQYWAAHTLAILTANERILEDLDRIIKRYHDGEIGHTFHLLTRFQDLLSEDIERSTRLEASRTFRNIFRRRYFGSDINKQGHPVLSNFLVASIRNRETPDLQEFFEISVEVTHHILHDSRSDEHAQPIVSMTDVVESILDLFVDKKLQNIAMKNYALTTLNYFLVAHPSPVPGAYWVTMPAAMAAFSQLYGGDGAQQKVLKVIIRSDCAIRTLLDFLRDPTDLRTLENALRALRLVTGSREGAARVGTNRDALELLVRCFLYRRHGHALLVLANLFYHSQLDLSESFHELGKTFKSFLNSLQGENHSDLWDISNEPRGWVMCNLIWAVGESEEGRKAMESADDAFHILEYTIRHRNGRSVTWATTVKQRVFPNR